MKATCTRLANPVRRLCSRPVSWQVAETIPDAEALGKSARRKLPASQGRNCTGSPVSGRTVRASWPRLAVIGFLSGRLLCAGPGRRRSRTHPSVVLFYGTGGGDFQRLKSSLPGPLCENDEFEPQSNVDELEACLRRAGRPVTFYRYSGTGHWFFEPDRTMPITRPQPP